jgi:hypothetical protein
VDIGEDGVVVASYAVEGAGGWLWGAYAPGGARIAAGAQPAAALTAVFVDSARGTLGLAFHRDDNTGHEPMVMPRVEAYRYALGPGAPALLGGAFTMLPWGAGVYRAPGPCDGDVADGRILDVRAGRDGSSLLVSGRSDGGDSPFRCGLRNASRVTPMTSLDAYTTTADMQSQGIVNLLVADPADGEVAVAQIQLTRLGKGGSGNGNSLFNRAAQVDARGAVYQLQDAACCIPEQANLTINGAPTLASGDAATLHILAPGLARRLHWTGFAAPGATGSPGSGVDLDVRGGAVALVVNTGQPMVAVAGLPGTGPDEGGRLVAYLVVLPTVT